MNISWLVIKRLLHHLQGLLRTRIDIVYCLWSWNAAQIKCYDFANSQNWGAASRHSKQCFKKKWNESSLFRRATKPWANEYLCWTTFTSWFRPHLSFESGWIDSSESALCFCSQFLFLFFSNIHWFVLFDTLPWRLSHRPPDHFLLRKVIRDESGQIVDRIKCGVAALPFCRLSRCGNNLRDGTVYKELWRPKQTVWKISIFHQHLRPPSTACQKARFLKGSTRRIFAPRRRKKHFSAGCEGALLWFSQC